MAPLLRFVLLAWLLAFAAGAAAQIESKAYAPEDLRRLAVPDQVRVIEKEYAEQSGGRLIPDDQLEFYLDQIRSGWTFSQIKADIAESLRGRRWQPPVSGWTPREVTCSSVDRTYAECRTPFRGPAMLTFQFSDSPCIEGRTWGQRPGVIWVDRGCRARFQEARGPAPLPPPSYGHGPDYDYGADSIICESRKGGRRRCPTGTDGPVQLVEQYSDADCIEGVTWAWTPGEVWVTRGCRARFEPVRRHQVYSVTCGSEDGRYRSCAWDRSQGRPVLIEQISRAACIEGSSWGYGRDGLWVDRGCRGRFGPGR